MEIKIPKELKDDSILEALCEFRFSSAVPLPSEVVIGRLSDCGSWQGYKVNRLPVSDFPEYVRMKEVGLRYLPLLELINQDGNQRIRIGGNVISFHIVKPYCGWSDFEPQLNGLVNCLFSKIKKITVERIGFRYVNALSANLHTIQSVGDLNVGITSGGMPITENFNLNYEREYSDSHVVSTRIATAGYVKGSIPNDTALVVDIDVRSTPKLAVNDVEAAMKWVQEAHGYEKQAYFVLFKKEKLDTLVKEW